MEAKGKCWFLEVEKAVALRTDKKIVAETVGTLAHSSQQEIVLGPPFWMSKEQAEYVGEIPPSLSPRSLLFSHFSSQGFYVLSGAAYGCDFLLYTHDPLLSHATAIVFLENSVPLPRLVEITRLAALCKKTCLVAAVEGGRVVVRCVTRVATSHIKPAYLPRVRE